MFAESVVEDLDRLEDVLPKATLSPEYSVANRGAFVSTVESFHCGVFTAVSFGAHARFELVNLVPLLITVARVGSASVTVMNNSKG